MIKMLNFIFLNRECSKGLFWWRRVPNWHYSVAKNSFASTAAHSQ